MPADDIIHDAVKNALIKDNWIVTADPYIIEYGKDRLYADLGAERPIEAEREGRKIVVEIKSFVGASLLHDLELAFGQYQIYRSILAVTAPDHQLFLAIQDIAYQRLTQRDTFRLLMQQKQLALIVVDTDEEVIVQWINGRPTTN